MTRTAIYSLQDNISRNLSMEDLSGEIWVDIPEYEGIYLVSNMGRVKVLARARKKSFIMKQWLNQNGYLQLLLIKGEKPKRFGVHRLVCLSFLPNPADKPQINHINFIRTDNRLVNLEWCTCKENLDHTRNHGRMPRLNMEGQLNTNSKLTESDIYELYNHLKMGGQKRDFYLRKGVGKATINEIINGKRWSHLNIDWSEIRVKYNHKL